uniref:Putative HNH endonuclease n=1 Tax=viral metagenome TaxID=1070528 RepID=A0A6M3LN22_9ZZZZ
MKKEKTCKIPLWKKDGTVRAEALIDADDYEKIDHFRWFITNSYPSTRINGKFTYLHSLILGNPQNSKLLADHKNRNTLDNRKENLRFIDKIGNSFNSKHFVTNTSGFKGVCWHSQTKKWRAYIGSKKKQIHLGLFNSKLAAARARENANILYCQF